MIPFEFCRVVLSSVISQVIISLCISFSADLPRLSWLDCSMSKQYKIPWLLFFFNENSTSGYAMVVHGRHKIPKIEVFWGSPSPQGSYSPYILGDTTRPGRVICVLVWSKSDRRRLRKTLHKQTDKQTNRQTDTTKIMVTRPWTNNSLQYWQKFYGSSTWVQQKWDVCCSFNESHSMYTICN